MVRPFPETPTAPPLQQDFDQIANYCDFILLGNNENYSIRADKKSIEESKTEFARMIREQPVPAEGECVRLIIKDVDRDDFELIVRFIETKFLKFRNPMHTLQILELASRFQCHDLEILCVKELDMFLSVTYVIPVFRALRCYNCVQPPRKAKDEKERDKKKKAKEVTLHSPEEYFAALLQNCLQLIEMQAETVFENPEMMKLRFEELEIVVRREALQMSSETVIFDLLAKWSNEECRRKNLEITAENRRRVLGALCFVPRYLNMSQRDFEVARDRVELLDPVEMKLVRDVLNGKKPQNVTPEQTRMLAAFKEPRPPFPLLPIYLSDRSNPKLYPKKMRKATEAIENGEVERGCCSKLGMGCATFFACVFD